MKNWILSLSLFAALPVNAMSPAVKACVERKAAAPEKTPEAPYAPPLPGTVADAITQALRQKIEADAAEKILETTLQEAGIGSAAELAGDLMRVYALARNVDGVLKADPDVQRFEAMYARASTAIGFWFPYVAIAMQIDLMMQRLIGGWSVADDYEYIEKLRLQQMAIRNQMIEMKKQELEANERALKVVRCEEEATHVRLKVFGALYERQECHEPLAHWTGEMTADRIMGCLSLGREILRETKLSYLLRSRIYADPFTQLLLEVMPEETDREQLATAMREHAALGPELTKNLRDSERQLRSFQQAILEQGDFARLQARADEKRQCRQLLRTRTESLTDAYRRRVQDPEGFALEESSYRRFLEVTCPEVATEKQALFGRRLLGN